MALPPCGAIADQGLPPGAVVTRPSRSLSGRLWAVAEPESQVTPLGRADGSPAERRRVLSDRGELDRADSGTLVWSPALLPLSALIV
jgi:hypothetical protein